MADQGSSNGPWSRSFSGWTVMNRLFQALCVLILLPLIWFLYPKLFRVLYTTRGPIATYAFQPVHLRQDGITPARFEFTVPDQHELSQMTVQIWQATLAVSVDQ